MCPCTRDRERKWTAKNCVYVAWVCACAFVATGTLQKQLLLCTFKFKYWCRFAKKTKRKKDKKEIHTESDTYFRACCISSKWSEMKTFFSLANIKYVLIDWCPYVRSSHSQNEETDEKHTQGKNKWSALIRYSFWCFRLLYKTAHISTVNNSKIEERWFSIEIYWFAEGQWKLIRTNISFFYWELSVLGWLFSLFQRLKYFTYFTIIFR